MAIPSMVMTERLIELVLQHAALFDPNHVDNRNNVKRDIIWESIGRQLQMTGEDAKKKWRSLRDTHAKYLKKEKHMQKSRHRKWVWADKMEPLRRIAMATHDDGWTWTADNKNDPALLKTEYDSENHTQDTDYYADTNEDNLNEDHNPQTTTNDLVDSNLNPEIPEITIDTSYRRHSRKSRSFQTHCPQPMSSVETVMDYVDEEKRPHLDPVDLLFLAHASTVKTFSGKRQAITKLKIAEVIMEQELLHQDELDEKKS